MGVSGLLPSTSCWGRQALPSAVRQRGAATLILKPTCEGAVLQCFSLRGDVRFRLSLTFI